ncbi:MAG: phage tail protein [Sulfurovaceae bacterium]|nr:phage tail protein [Sulfurovaceae bacterium]
MNHISQLPKHYTQREHNADIFTATVLDKLRPLIAKLKVAKNPWLCDEVLLDQLAIAKQTPFYDQRLDVKHKREIIGESFSAKQIIGTKASIHKALAMTGLDTSTHPAIIIEYWDKETYIYRPILDGLTVPCDGAIACNGGENMLSFVLEKWNDFGIWLSKPIGKLEEIFTRQIIEKYKPARSNFLGFMFAQCYPCDGMSFKCDGTIKTQ